MRSQKPFRSEEFAALTQEQYGDDSIRAEDGKSNACEKYASSVLTTPNGAKWATWTKEYRHLIILFWTLIVWPVGLYTGPKFILSTTMKVAPVFGSLSQEAKHIYLDAFQVNKWCTERPLIVVLDQNEKSSNVTLIDGTSELYHSTRDFVFDLGDLVEEMIISFGDSVPFKSEDSGTREREQEAQYIEKLQVPEAYVSVKSYYTFERDKLFTMAKQATATKDGRTTTVVMDLCVPPNHQKMLIDAVVDYGKNHVPMGVTISFTGIDLFQDDSVLGVVEDMEFMDCFVGPLAMVILAFVLGNLPIMVIPLLTITTSVLCAVALMYPIARYVAVCQLTPGIIVSLIVALSVDYSLFLLSRCSEDIALGMTNEDAILSMIKHSGHTITVSAFTLSGCCMGILLLPQEWVATVGLGACVGVLSTFIVNVSLTPALMYTSMGHRFLKPNRFFSAICCNQEGNPGRTSMQVKRTMPTQSYKVISDFKEAGCICEQGRAEKEVEGDLENMIASIWFRMGKEFLHPCKGALILLIVVGFAAPVARFFPELVHALDPWQVAPSHSPSMLTFDHLGEKFGRGVLAPYKIIFDGRSSGSYIDTEESFAIMSTVLNELAGADFPATPTLASYSGIATIGGIEVPFSVYEAAMQCNTNCSNEFFKTLATLAQNELNSPDNMTTFAYAILNVDPFGKDGIDWLRNARRTIQRLSDDDVMQQKIQVAIEGEIGVIVDCVDAISSRFPVMVAATLFAVYLLMGLFFQSILIPLLSIVSILLTQAFVYGLMVLVYQRGALTFLGMRSLSQAGAVYWVVPIICFTIVVGLGLDYDVFLITRVLEYRLSGYTHKSSILKATYKTRGIISAAGVIMSIALGGLLNSRTMMINQTSFLLTSAVLMDTFVIRTMVVPILMGYLGDYTWWPRTLPPAIKDISNL